MSLNTCSPNQIKWYNCNLVELPKIQNQLEKNSRWINLSTESFKIQRNFLTRCLQMKCHQIQWHRLEATCFFWTNLFLRYSMICINVSSRQNCVASDAVKSRHCSSFSISTFSVYVFALLFKSELSRLQIHLLSFT